MAKLTFYVNSDNIQTKSKDKARIKAIMNSFKKLGHKVVDCGVGSDVHSHPKKFGCTKKNDVWVCIFGGVCGGTIADQTGYTGFGNWFKNDELKKAHLMYIFMNKPEGKASDLNTIKKLPKAHDDNFSPKSFKGIPNPKTYLNNHGVTWIQGGTTSKICSLIESQNWQGTGFNISGSGQISEQTSTIKISHGFDKQKPFEAYILVEYAVGSKKGKTKKLYIDWQTKAPSNTSVPQFPNSTTPTWVNNAKYIHEIGLLEHIKSAEGDYDKTNSTKYYLKKVSFLRNFADIYDDKETEEDESKLYNTNTDKSSYKMLLYDLGVFNGEVMNTESLGTTGKTLLDATKNILDKSEYEFQIKYGKHRNNDYINFSQHTNVEENVVHTFNEGFEGDIIGISNIKYSPTKDLINDCITIYKVQAEDKSKHSYRYTRQAKLSEVLRFGEQTHIENISDSTNYANATQHSYDSLMKSWKPYTTYTLKTVGLPNVAINDWVATKTVNPLLTNQYQVASRKINIDVNNRPMISTELGLGDIDTTMKVKNNLAKQRKALVRTKLDLNEEVRYEDKLALDEMVWID